MLDRLQELRDAAKSLRPEIDPDVTEAFSLTEPERDPAVQTALAQDVLSWSACDDLRVEVESFQNITAQVQRVVLPTKLQQLASSLKSQEDIVQTRIRRAKGLIDTLRTEEPGAQKCVKRIRENLSHHVTATFKELVQKYFDTRQGHREETLRRARRQLRIAFPEARDNTLEDILEYPELAAIAIARRLERGHNAHGASIEAVLSELDSTRGDLIRLEDGARELKAMFFKFAELVDSQGEALNNVEAQVHEAADHIADAVAIYKKAEASKEDADWRLWTFRLKVAVLLFIIFCVFNYKLVFWSAYWAASGTIKTVAGAGAAAVNSLPGNSEMRNAASLAELPVPAHDSQIFIPSRQPVFLEVQTERHHRSARLQTTLLHHDDVSDASALGDHLHSRSEVSAEGILRTLHVSDSIERLISEGSRTASLSTAPESAIAAAEVSDVASAHLRNGRGLSLSAVSASESGTRFAQEFGTGTNGRRRR